jgi:hypothetical protein
MEIFWSYIQGVNNIMFVLCECENTVATWVFHVKIGEGRLKAY